jgi:hypothetical protein
VSIKPQCIMVSVLVAVEKKIHNDKNGKTSCDVNPGRWMVHVGGQSDGKKGGKSG